VDFLWSSEVWGPEEPLREEAAADKLPEKVMVEVVVAEIPEATDVAGDEWRFWAGGGALSDGGAFLTGLVFPSLFLLGVGRLGTIVFCEGCRKKEFRQTWRGLWKVVDEL
jgi:hypothetical protein